MRKKKDTVMFGTASQLKSINYFVQCGLGSIMAGVIVIIIAGRQFYKNVKGIRCEDPSSDTIDSMYKTFTKDK